MYIDISMWWEDRKLMRLRRTKMGWHTLDIALGRKSDRCTCFASSTIIARAETGLFYKKAILSFPLVLTWLLAIWIYVFFVHMGFLLCSLSSCVCISSWWTFLLGKARRKPSDPQSHNDWSAETTLFLTLVARCYSDAGSSKFMKNAFNFSE